MLHIYYELAVPIYSHFDATLAHPLIVARILLHCGFARDRLIPENLPYQGFPCFFSFFW